MKVRADSGGDTAERWTLRVVVVSTRGEALHSRGEVRRLVEGVAEREVRAGDGERPGDRDGERDDPPDAGRECNGQARSGGHTK